MSKEAYYFSHDANARHDPKILALRSEYGVKGYGIYWIIIEMLREQEGYKLPLKKYIFNAIAMQVQCKDFAKDDAKVFVENCINEYELFAADEGFFWSNSLLKRMDKKQDLSEKRRAAAKARWDKSSDSNDSEKKDKQNNANAMQVDANAKQADARKGKEKKEKESKEKENINNKDDEAAPLSEKDVFKFYAENLQIGLAESPFNLDSISHWIKDLSAEVVLEAMKESVKREIKGFNYTEKILKDWANRKITSLPDIEKMRAAFEKKSSRSGTGRRVRKEPEPAWLGEQTIPEPAEESADMTEERRRLEEKLQKYRKEQGE